MSDLAVLLPPRPSTILRPGLRSLPFGTERYVVKGGGSLTVRIAAGDRLKLVDIEGLQAAELLATGADGRADTGMLGIAGGKPLLRVFGSGAAGETCEFTVQRDGLLKVSAPGGVMDFARQDTATDLLL